MRLAAARRAGRPAQSTRALQTRIPVHQRLGGGRSQQPPAERALTATAPAQTADDNEGWEDLDEPDATHDALVTKVEDLEANGPPNGSIQIKSHLGLRVIAKTTGVIDTGASNGLCNDIV